MITLRPYQQEAIDAVLAARQRGTMRQLVALPTGSGKTLIVGNLARTLNAQTLILAHRDELIEQAVDKVQMIWPEADIGVIKAERNETGHQLTVASVQTLSRPQRLSQIDPCDLLVVDEAHHAIAPSYRRIFKRLPNVLHIGVTATPCRGDGLGSPRCMRRSSTARPSSI